MQKEVSNSEDLMELNYYKLLNFVSKLSRPKIKDEALLTLSRIDEKKGNSAIDIFENGIDNAEAIIAIEARRLLSSINTTASLDLNKMTKESQNMVLDEEGVVTRAFKATGGNVLEMHEMTGIPIRTIYKKLKKYNLNRKDYDFAQ